jgi:hypothetical protein
LNPVANGSGGLEESDTEMLRSYGLLTLQNLQR